MFESQITQHIVNSVKADYALESCEASFLFGVSRKGVQVKEGRRRKTVYGFFYVDELNRDTYRSVLQEAKLHGIQAPYRIYGRFEVLQSPNVSFVNVQDWRSIVRRQLSETTK